MNDRLRLIILALFLILLVSPFGWAFFQPDYPEAVLAPAASASGGCLAEPSLMRAGHGRLLKSWRHLALREGRRQGPWPPLTPSGPNPRPGRRIWAYSLDTCRSCHPNRGEFCLKCHERIGAAPACFNCHWE